MAQESQEMWVWSLGWEDTLEEGMATHTTILAWSIPWTEQPGGLQSIESHRVGHDWSHLACTQTTGHLTSVSINVTQIHLASVVVYLSIKSHSKTINSTSHETEKWFKSLPEAMEWITQRDCIPTSQGNSLFLQHLWSILLKLIQQWYFSCFPL